MAASEKPWKAEYAKSARASCRTCKDNIGKEVLRLGKMVQSSHFDGFMPMWHHATCIMRKPNQIKFIDDVEGIESLRWEDQQKIRKYIDGAGLSGNTGAAPKPTTAPIAVGIEASQTSRATCKHCSNKIMKGEVRISSKSDSGAKGLTWYHAACFVELFPSTTLNSLLGWEDLSSSDQASVRSAAKGKVPIATDAEAKAKGGAKRKTTDGSNQPGKTAKTEPNMSMKKCASQADTNAKEVIDSELESKLEAQSRALWALKDDLKKHVSTAEMREMLEVNEQSTSGSELDLRDRCADGMIFGALAQCSLCSGHLHYSRGIYRCYGYLSEWSKCSYSTTQPERIKGKWKIPENTDNQYLLKWFESQKAVKPARLLPPPSKSSTGTPAANGQSKSSKDEKLGHLRVSMVGLPKDTMEEFKSKIEGAGGEVHAKVKKGTNCLVVGGDTGENAEMKKARRMKIPIVREDYLVNCFERQKKLPFDHYKIEVTGESSGGVMTVKVKGRSAVHEASGLQDSGHILEDGTCIYNTTLSMSDLCTGINSYYILQIIQDDSSSDCYVFRKWGRVGNEKIGGSKLDEFSKSNAILEFKRLFLEKTGNPWEAWVNKDNFQKHPGRFFPLDIDYGVKHTPKKNLDDEKSLLAPPLKELIKMLFNIENYRAAMMEFEINLSEMPLGKLSKTNIQRGFEALTQIQNLLGNSDLENSVRESLIVDASNRFFTVIPSIHPHVIRDEDVFKTKVKMLEALQDIEIASRLVGFDSDIDDSLDDKYKKLHCGIVPLSHDSEDYQLIKKYLLNTHAPTHTEWRLELEEVFALEREGEFDRFRPHREKLGNRMLLWHGSRLTNFVGILSQGLRVAPPEAPATGYMFGKGVYFADLVSKSAQYCYTDRKNPVGLMLLSEVALGQIHELKKAQYMDKPPKGKHSTKGLGKKVPDESEFQKWRDDVVVPCGNPVNSSVKTSVLMYNEYIVYDPAQVKMQFLLKVRFHYKRK